uniref:Uncharacterized protein n=1 Tax=uncultured bacterium Contig575 TaxID=1393592 RepID=W0FHZ0_9BACT|nr:hypothetical protein [uncultured bacterium Contig575]
MNNKDIYRRTLSFSIRRLLWDVAAFLILAALAGAGYLLAEKLTNRGLIGLGIGALAGIIAVAIFLRYISYTYKAGQIAMMTRAVAEGTLPEDVIGEGKKVVKERFATVAAFFAVTRIISGIFNQLGNGIISVGEKLGGDSGKTVGNAISIILQVIISYLSDCCLGWVFYRRNVKAARATCEGAVLFFKHGKTLARNMGRVFGMGLASLVAIGGAFTGVFYLIASRFPALFARLGAEVAEAAVRLEQTIPAYVTEPNGLMWICAALAGVILWAILHTAFVRPFVLVGVLRNYIESGIQEIPSEASFALLDSKSAKFKKLHANLA